VNADRAWNTWDARYPGAMVHLPTGLTVRLSAFAGGSNAYTDFPYSPDIRLGPHLPDGSFVALALEHAGSRVLMRFAKPSADTVVGDVQVLHLAGWGLRFWILLEVGFDAVAEGGRVTLAVPEGEKRYQEPPVALLSTAAGGSAAFSTASMPVGAYLYEERADARDELETGGYYARPPLRDEGRWAQFRFAATESRYVFAVHLEAGALEDAADGAVRGLRATLAAADETLAERAAVAAAEPSPRREAVRDVVAWNTVWDPVNARPYTTATRAWAPAKFGGWFVWLSDAFYSALLAAYAGDADTAIANIDAALSNATDAGNLAGLMSGRTRWIDRSQLPIGAHATWVVHRLTGDRAVLERAYPVLLRAFEWWFAARDGNGNGLLEPGSSPAGDGHFVHTKQAALDEAAMDNSPIYDEATFDLTTHTLDLEDVALNSQLVLEAETLARIAEELGRPPEEAAHLRERAAALAALVREQLWDPSRTIFANRLWNGTFVRSVGPSSFYPMAAGIATTEQAKALVADHLQNPWEFGGDHPVAGTPFDDPAATDNVYWRGRVWPTMNYLVWLGLRRYGFEREAKELADKGWRMFAHGWADRRCWENLNQRTGEGGDSPDSDPFYTWGALLALIGELDPGEPFAGPARGGA
jgi:putative isomerase